MRKNQLVLTLLSCLCLVLMVGCTKKDNNHPVPMETTTTLTETTDLAKPGYYYEFTEKIMDHIDELYENDPFYRDSTHPYRNFQVYRSADNVLYLASALSYHTYQIDEAKTIINEVIYYASKSLSYDQNNVHKEAHFESRIDIQHPGTISFTLVCEEGWLTGMLDTTKRQFHIDDNKMISLELQSAFLLAFDQVMATDVNGLAKVNEEIVSYIQANILQVPRPKEGSYLHSARKHKDYTPDNNQLGSTFYDASNSVELMLKDEFLPYKDILDASFKFAIGTDHAFSSLEEMSLDPYVIYSLIETAGSRGMFYYANSYSTSDRTFVGRNGETIVDENTKEAYRAMLYEEDFYDVMEAVLGYRQDVSFATMFASTYRYWSQSPYIFISLNEGDRPSGSSAYSIGPNLWITEITELNHQLVVTGYRYENGVLINGKDGVTLYQDDSNIERFVLSHKQYLEAWEYILEKQVDGSYKLVSGTPIH